MRILHTADWHLGRRLYGRERYEEFSGFLDWLIETVEGEGVEVILLAGDVFDTCTPSNRAQELYYKFLGRVSQTGCRHVVVIGGNHDSPSFLDAPRGILRALDVHVVGAMGERVEDEVIELRGENGEIECLVGAVPYLRDKDIRRAESGEGYEEKNEKLMAGVREHYARVGEVAMKRQALIYGKDGRWVPVLGMGHLFTAGGRVVEGDGVRDLYVGSLVHVEVELFPEVFDYVALGHLHVAQKVGGDGRVRYSGSPIPMGYGEARQEKSVVLVDVVEADGGSEERGCEERRGMGEAGKVGVECQLLSVPCFQRLEGVRGDLGEIEERIEELVADGSDAWLEVEYEGSDPVGDLRERVERIVEGSRLEIRRIKDKRVLEAYLKEGEVGGDVLEDLSVRDVFEKCLDAYKVEEESRGRLRELYGEVVAGVEEGGEV